MLGFKHRFASNAALMASKESRRTVRLYNRVAAALVEFEVSSNQCGRAVRHGHIAGSHCTSELRHRHNRSEAGCRRLAHCRA